MADDELPPQPVRRSSYLQHHQFAFVTARGPRSAMAASLYLQVWEGPLDEDGKPHGLVSGGAGLGRGCKGDTHLTLLSVQHSPRCHGTRRNAGGPWLNRTCKPLSGVQGKMEYPPPPMGEDDEEEKPGDKFEGTMEHGVRTGKGTYTWGVSGAVYTGDYVNGKKHGKGKMVYPDKGVYEGEGCGGRANGGSGVRHASDTEQGCRAG